jgi:hypothetical protein
MSFPLSFSKFEATPLSKTPAKVLIQWDLCQTKLPLTDFEFRVDRGSAADAEPGFQHVTIDGKPMSDGTISTDSVNLTQVAGPISGIDFYQWADYSGELANLQKIYFYRVRLRRISTQEEIETPVFTWNTDLDLEGLYVVEEHNFLLEDSTGVPALTFPRKRGGMTCPNCFDPIQKKRTSSYCLRCFGTNWDGGFYNPIDSYIDFNPSPQNTVIKDWGETQPNETNVFLTNYPLLGNGDVIRELQNGKLWRVTRTQPAEKRRMPTLQFARVVEINPGDVETKIPYDQTLALQILERFRKIRKLRAF